MVLFDAHRQPGGMLRYGIPEFRLPRDVLDREINVIRKLGGEFRLQTKLGKDLTFEQLRRDFQALFLAIGAQGSRGLGCAGEELALPAVDFLAQVTDGQPPAIGREVIVVGGGNTAMDAARTAIRLGANSVKVFYRRTRQEMPCLMEEVEAAEAEGVHLELLVAPVRLDRNADRLRLTCQRMELGLPDESGRRRPVAVAGSEFTVEATCVIAAIGQAVELGSDEAPGVELSKWGVSVNPHTLVTNLDGVFAGRRRRDGTRRGDPRGRRGQAGRSLDRPVFVRTKSHRITRARERDDGPTGREELAICSGKLKTSRARMPELPMADRRATFQEVDLGLLTTWPRTNPPVSRLRLLESHDLPGCGLRERISRDPRHF